MTRLKTTTVSTPSSNEPHKLSGWLDIEIEKAIRKIEGANRVVTDIAIASHGGDQIAGLFATISHVPAETHPTTTRNHDVRKDT